MHEKHGGNFLWCNSSNWLANGPVSSFLNFLARPACIVLDMAFYGSLTFNLGVSIDLFKDPIINDTVMSGNVVIMYLRR